MGDARDAQLGRCGSGGDLLALSALGRSGHFRCVLGVAEGQQVSLLGHVVCDLWGERHDLAVNDRVVALGTVVVGVLDHDLRIGQSSSRVGVADDLGYLFGEWAVGLVFADERYADYAPNEREVEMVDRAFGEGLDG
jgi:hypothetical protein